MNYLAERHLHDLRDEDWNAYGEITDIWTQKFALHAPYTNFNGSSNSLLPNAELSFTETATFYLAFRLWPGAEAYFVPEIIGEKPLSNLVGLGGTIQNFELQKQGSSIPTPYLSRSYVRQTIGLGGGTEEQTSDPQRLGHFEDRRKLVFTAGNFSILDFFDKNNVAGAARRGFFNMSFLTYAAYDFAADARGYAWGGIAELDWDDWIVHFGRITPPKDPNQLPLDFRLDKVYGDQLEIEHDHKLFGHEGAVRVLGYRNVENMGRFSDAIAAFEKDPQDNAANCGAAGLFHYGSTNAHAPDLCYVRRSNTKVGIGLSIEQKITDRIGVFVRGMYSDGDTEVYSYTSTDRSISLGGTTKGGLWGRPLDLVGTGWSQGWISDSHAQYLAMGGVDGFIGDGKLNRASEGIYEIFYAFAFGDSSWITADYQHIVNPAYNADRGSVNILGGRLHVEF